VKTFCTEFIRVRNAALRTELPLLGVPVGVAIGSSRLALWIADNALAMSVHCAACGGLQLTLRQGLGRAAQSHGRRFQQSQQTNVPSKICARFINRRSGSGRSFLGDAYKTITPLWRSKGRGPTLENVKRGTDRLQLRAAMTIKEETGSQEDSPSTAHRPVVILPVSFTCWFLNARTEAWSRILHALR
jgi:hypothetical protein